MSSGPSVASASELEELALDIGETLCLWIKAIPQPRPKHLAG